MQAAVFARYSRYLATFPYREVFSPSVQHPIRVIPPLWLTLRVSRDHAITLYHPSQEHTGPTLHSDQAAYLSPLTHARPLGSSRGGSVSSSHSLPTSLAILERSAFADGHETLAASSAPTMMVCHKPSTYVMIFC